MTNIKPHLINVSGQKIDRKRLSNGSYVGGRYVPGTPTITSNLEASIQDPSGKYIDMINQFPEGKRTRVWIVVYTELDTLRSADDRNNITADFIVYEGDEYEVQAVTHRRGKLLNFDVALAVRTEN